MSIRVGTLVKRYEAPNAWTNDYFPCERYNRDMTDDSDIPVKLYVCVGMVQEVPNQANVPNPEVPVHWMTMCGYHRKLGLPAQTLEFVDNLWEVGQLA